MNLNSARCQQDWSSATKVAKAFSIGRLESAAIVNLVSKIQPCVVEALTEAVRARGMPKLITHEAIGKVIFNLGFSSGVAASEAWKDVLTNRHFKSWICVLSTNFRVVGLWVYSPP